MRVPSPPQNRTTFMTSSSVGSMTCTSGIGTMNLAPQSADMAHLRDDLVLQVPGQDQDVVGLGLVDRLDRLDRNVHARREAAVLVGIAVDREVEEVGADAAVVEQRVALARRAVAADRLALRPWRRSGTTAACAWSAAPSRRSARRSRCRVSRASLLAREQRVDARGRTACAELPRARDRPAAIRRASAAPRRR